MIPGVGNIRRAILTLEYAAGSQAELCGKCRVGIGQPGGGGRAETIEAAGGSDNLKRCEFIVR